MDARRVTSSGRETEPILDSDMTSDLPPVHRSVWRDLFGRKPGVFFACFAAWTLANMDQALFGYAIPGILAEFSLPLSAAGLILTVSFLVAAVFIVLAGMAADRWGRGLMITVLLATSAFAVGMQGLAGSVLVLTLFRALGFGLSGGLSPATNAIVVENATPRLRGVTAGLLQCGYPLGWLLASLFAAPLLDLYSWRSICLVAFLVIPLAIPIGLMLRRYGVTGPPTAGSAIGPAATQSNNRLGIRQLFTMAHRRNSLAAIAMFFTFGGAYAGSAFFFPAFFTQARGYTEGEAAALVGLSNGIAIFGYLAAALIGEFVLTRRNVFALWCAGGAAALAGLLWLSEGRGPDLIWYGLTAAFFFGSQAVVIVLVAELFPASVRATAIAVCGSAPLSLGFAVFPLLVPLVVERIGWEAGLSAIIIPLLIASALAALILPNRVSGLYVD